MNQAVQTHVFIPLFASAVHPCPMPYARAMSKKAKGSHARVPKSVSGAVDMMQKIWLRIISKIVDESSLIVNGSGMPDPYGLVQDFSRRGEACLAQRFTDFISAQMPSMKPKLEKEVNNVFY